MPRVRKSAVKDQSVQQVAPAVDATSTIVALIQSLIPLGLQAVADALRAEVEALAGPRYSHADAHPDHVRWGSQRGSVYLADQKLAVTVPRVRNQAHGVEVPLATYQALQTPRGNDLGLFRRVLSGISTRDYAAAAEAVPEAFGMARSSVSRRFVRASACTLEALQHRRLDTDEWLVLFLDGKTFARDQLVIALGVTRTGEKRVLGLVQTATENARVCTEFLRDLQARGFTTPAGLLVVLDGAKGLRAAVRDVFGDVPVQRCQWHKRENVVSYLPKNERVAWRRKLQAAYAEPTYAGAKRALERVGRELAVRNASAARSLAEGLEETLTLHRLGVVTKLGLVFKTTNLIETVMARIDATTHRVHRWRTSDQKLRWCAAALLRAEPQFRRVKGYHHLPLLEHALATNLNVAATAAA